MTKQQARRIIKDTTCQLTYNDLLFCLEYVKNGQNGTQAYKAVHPKVSDHAARVLACRRLAKDSVQEQLQRLYRAAIPDTVASVKADLDLAQELARKSGDPAVIASVAMDRAKLSGLLVDKQEVKKIDDAEHSPIRQLVASSLPQVQSG